jgi:hypothetical protein
MVLWGYSCPRALDGSVHRDNVAPGVAHNFSLSHVFPRLAPTPEFRFDAAQKVVFGHFLGFDWGSFALKNQFVFRVLEG